MNFFIRFIFEKYVYVVGVSIAIVAFIEIFKAYHERKWGRLILMVIIFFSTTAVPIYELVTRCTVEKQEFSIRAENINFSQGDKGNIIFQTDKNIDEPIDLRIKDTWIHLVYLTDYDVKNDRNVIMNYEFGNNDESNKKVANQGLIFTYKARKFK